MKGKDSSLHLQSVCFTVLNAGQVHSQPYESTQQSVNEKNKTDLKTSFFQSCSDYKMVKVT